MKKIFSFACVAALMMFASCNGSKTEENNDTIVAETEEITVEEVDSSALTPDTPVVEAVEAETPAPAQEKAPAKSETKKADTKKDVVKDAATKVEEKAEKSLDQIQKDAADKAKEVAKDAAKDAKSKANAWKDKHSAN